MTIVHKIPEIVIDHGQKIIRAKGDADSDPWSRLPYLSTKLYWKGYSYHTAVRGSFESN